MADLLLGQGREVATRAASTRTASTCPQPRLHPRQLAALGTVLCLYRPQHGSELSGWAQAVRVEARIGVESDGLRESLIFFDREGRCCWHLWLLPDSDFLAWDRLAASVPSRDAGTPQASIGERLWQRLARRLTANTGAPVPCACMHCHNHWPRPCLPPAWLRFPCWVPRPRATSPVPKVRKWNTSTWGTSAMIAAARGRPSFQAMALPPVKATSRR